MIIRRTWLAIYIGLYAVADFKAVHAGKLDLDFSSSSLLLLLLFFVCVCGLIVLTMKF